MATLGRPRKACDMCKSQKIRCSSNRPTCKRCLRLGRTCIYGRDAHAENSNASREASTEIKKHTKPTSKLVAVDNVTTTGSEKSDGSKQHPPLLTPLLNLSPRDQYHLGIPQSLILELVDVYYNNVYNASLLLHKRLFLESVAAGTGRAHVLLSVCAWAANFSQHGGRHGALMEYGFMADWAQKAGRLVLEGAEDPHEENLVTHINLCLFWHSQGSWRRAYFHKGLACQVLSILGIGASTRTENSLTSEIRRRRFWACYLANCHISETLLHFKPPEEMLMSVLLPWPEEDFDAGVCEKTQFTLASSKGSGGVWSELIKVLTIWYSVISMTRRPESSLTERITDIYGLEQKVMSWWRELWPDLKLTPSKISGVHTCLLPRVLLLNIVYHHCMCALHASIVPLFCWGTAADDTWSSARQLSAQRAFEHACAASQLINAVLSSYTRLSAMPSFVAYACYCGCAIQIPFLWCSNPTVRQRAYVNVGANVKMIRTMATHWKIAALLKVHAHCMYNIYKRRPTILEDEPKYVAVTKLTNFKVHAANAREPIRDPAAILHAKGRDGLAEPGDEASLAIENDSIKSNKERSRELSQTGAGREDRNFTLAGDETTNARLITPEESSSSSSSSSICPGKVSKGRTPLDPREESHTARRQFQTGPLDRGLLDYPSTQESQRLFDMENQTIDAFYPFFDPDMLNLSHVAEEVPSMSQFEIEQMELDYFDMAGWGNTAFDGEFTLPESGLSNSM